MLSATLFEESSTPFRPRGVPPSSAYGQNRNGPSYSNRQPTDCDQSPRNASLSPQETNARIEDKTSSATTVQTGIVALTAMNLPRFGGHGNSKKERGPDGSKKERAPSVYGAIQKPGSGDGDPQRQECGADSARAWMQRSESAWMEEGIRLVKRMVDGREAGRS